MRAALVLSETGMGKSSSMRNMSDDICSVISVTKKRLPFPAGKLTCRYASGYKDVKDFVSENIHKPILVIDDVYYLMSDFYVANCENSTYKIFDQIAMDFMGLIDFIDNKSPDFQTVYMLGHSIRDESGYEKFKIVGKMLEQKIGVEGKFESVIKCVVRKDSAGKNIHQFALKNNNDVTKTPFGMFDCDYMDNDLLVFDTIYREFYGIPAATFDDQYDFWKQKFNECTDKESLKVCAAGIKDSDVSEITKQKLLLLYKSIATKL